MKTLSNHTMVYDADCPLCIAYTGAFIKAEMLDKEGRIPYQQVGGEFVPGMDAERSKNEIALVNRETGEVKYGLESLLTIIETRFKWIGTIARIQPLKFLIQKLYNFISYNRKVIAPAQAKRDVGSETMTPLKGTAPRSGVTVSDLTREGQAEPVRYDCTPTFKLKYRVAYILMVWFFTSVVLVKFSHLLGGLIPSTNFYREFLICGGQVAFQSMAMGILLVARAVVPPSEVRRRGKAEQLMDYLGNMMTVSFIGAILLLPALGLGLLISYVPAFIYLAYFMLVVGVMLFEHARRMKLLGLGGWPSVSWVLYRMIVLAIILI